MKYETEIVLYNETGIPLKRWLFSHNHPSDQFAVTRQQGNNIVAFGNEIEGVTMRLKPGHSLERTVVRK